jgi:hypothetical protein
MASPLLALLTHFWALGEASGNRANSLGANPHPFVPGGTITKVTGQMAGGGQADQFGAAWADHLAIPYVAGAPQLDQDFTMGMFVRLPNPVPGNVNLFGRGQWYGRFDFALWSGSGAVSAYLGDGKETPNAIPFAAPLNPNVYGNGSIVHSQWVWISVRHTVATKTLDFFLGQAQAGTGLQCVSRTYTGTIVDSTLPIRINGLANDAVPLNSAFAAQGVFYAPALLSDRNILALYNLGQGLLPPFTAYATEGAVPGLATAPRYAFTNALVASTVCLQFGNGQDTVLSPVLTVQHATTDLQFGWVNAVTRGVEGEGFEPAKHSTVTIEASYFVEGDTAATPLTFGGNPSATLAYGTTAYADPITRVLYRNQNIRVLTYYVASGSSFAPATLQLTGSSGRRGTGTKTLTDINTANYTTGASSFDGFSPTLARGYIVGPTAANGTVGIIGDSIAAPVNTYVRLLGTNSGTPHIPCAVSGARASTLYLPENNAAVTEIFKGLDTIIDQIGVNDLNLTNRAFVQFKSDKTACWTRWCGSGSAIRKMVVATLTPMTQIGAAPNMAVREVERRAWNAFLRSVGTNADFGAMTGRPTLVYRWDGAAYTSSGARSAGTGLPLDVYVLDTAAVTENNPTTGDNLWSTTTAGGTKVDCSAVSAGDGIHPSPTEAANMATLLQPRYSAALAAPMAEAPAVSNDDEEEGEENMIPDAIYDRACGTNWEIDNDVVAGDKVRLTGSRHGDEIEYWVIGATLHTDTGVRLPESGRVVTIPTGGVLQYRSLSGTPTLMVEVQSA